jgi:hypothetical protein
MALALTVGICRFPLMHVLFGKLSLVSASQPYLQTGTNSESGLLHKRTAAFQSQKIGPARDLR